VRYSIEYKRRMVQRLVGRDAVTAHELARTTGISQITLSRWLREARRLPAMADRKLNPKQWTIDEKIRILAEAAKLEGAELTAFLERENVLLGEIQEWREALDENGDASQQVFQRLRKLERELARKDKALAEAAALLVLKKKLRHLAEDADEEPDEPNEK
jgi:transposase-like protein